MMGRQDESKRRKDICIECVKYKPIKARKLCNNCNQKYLRKNNPVYYAKYRYTNIKQRVFNKNLSQSDTYFGMEICSKEEFLDFTLNCKEYFILFTNWKSSGYKHSLIPSIDRINNSRGYNIDNLQWITQSENASKDLKKKCEVYRYGKYIGTYSSITEAVNSNKDISLPSVKNIFSGKKESVNGYVFKKIK